MSLEADELAVVVLVELENSRLAVGAVHVVRRGPDEEKAVAEVVVEALVGNLVRAVRRERRFWCMKRSKARRP